jgi:hypothetical protein
LLSTRFALTFRCEALAFFAGIRLHPIALDGEVEHLLHERQGSIRKDRSALSEPLAQVQHVATP